MTLPELDVEFLTEKGYKYETQVEGGVLNIVFHEYRLPESYRPTVVDLLVRLPAGYPNGRPDMFWTRPTVTLANGTRPRTADAMETYLGLQWQRWSRHGTTWRPGVDCLRTFMASIKSELQKGI